MWGVLNSTTMEAFFKRVSVRRAAECEHQAYIYINRLSKTLWGTFLVKVRTALFQVNCQSVKDR